MLKESLNKYIEDLSSSRPTPGGGSAAAVVNALACSLMLMSLRIAVLKKDPSDINGRKKEKELLKLKDSSLNLAEQDSLFFAEVIKNWKRKGKELEKSLRNSALVSLKISRAAMSLIDLINTQELKDYVNIMSDVAISVRFASSAFESGIINCRINLSSMSERDISIQKDSREMALIFSDKVSKLNDYMDSFYK